MNGRRTAEDVTSWTVFASQVERAVRSPDRSMVDLDRACARAYRAVLPCEPYTAQNPWLACLNLAQRFAGSLAVNRVDMAGDLEAALIAAQAHCQLRLGVPAPPERPAPQLPFRRDIDG